MKPWWVKERIACSRWRRGGSSLPFIRGAPQDRYASAIFNIARLEAGFIICATQSRLLSELQPMFSPDANGVVWPAELTAAFAPRTSKRDASRNWIREITGFGSGEASGLDAAWVIDRSYRNQSETPRRQDCASIDVPSRVIFHPERGREPAVAVVAHVASDAAAAGFDIQRRICGRHAAACRVS